MAGGEERCRLGVSILRSLGRVDGSVSKGAA